MAQCTWEKLNVGDFFTPTFQINEDEVLLYQKIQETDKGFNALLLNKGLLCCLFTSGQLYEKVEVTFSLKPTE
jgi:hypothetical protein